jgi:hypothetical protein
VALVSLSHYQLLLRHSGVPLSEQAYGAAGGETMASSQSVVRSKAKFVSTLLSLTTLFSIFFIFFLNVVIFQLFVTEQVSVAVTLETCIREVVGSNLRKDTDYPY